MEDWAKTVEPWISLASLSVGHLPDNGGLECVYAFRSIASREILYIGSTNNLRRRVFGNYLGGIGGDTTQRLHEVLLSQGQVANVELAYERTPDYRQRERQLRDAYRQRHGRLPSWNRI